MTMNDKLSRVRSVLEDHNSQIDTTNPNYLNYGWVNIDHFFSLVKALGGTSEDRLKRFSHEEIAECLPMIKISPLDNNGKPDALAGKSSPQTVLAKEIASIFREKSDTEVSVSKRPVTSVKAERMTLEELISAYDPSEADSPVANRLSKIAKGEAFIIFSSGRELDVDSTLKLLKEVKQGYKGRDIYIVNGVPKSVYKVGYLPENYADENPLYPGRPLRPDGTCDQTNRSWEGIDYQLRQFVRIAIDIGLIQVNRDMSHNMLDLLVGPNPYEAFNKRYPQAVVAYEDLATQGKLPVLKIALGNNSKNPFKYGKKVNPCLDFDLPNLKFKTR